MTPILTDKPTIETSWQLIEILNKDLFVYGLFRDTQYLFIKAVEKGLVEMHRFLHKKVEVLPTDAIHIWLVDMEQQCLLSDPSLAALRALETGQLYILEQQLQEQYKPLHRGFTSKPVCKYCEKDFVPIRDWQVYCDDRCREGAARKRMAEKKTKFEVHNNCVHCKGDYVVTDKLALNWYYCPTCRALIGP